MKRNVIARSSAGILAMVLTLLLFMNVQTVPADSGGPGYININPQEVLQIIREHNGEVMLLDVRTADEFASGHINGAKLVPVSELPARINELDKENSVIVYCKSGKRSQTAAEILVQAGFASVYNLMGGIEAWKEAGLPVSGDDRTDGCAPCLGTLVSDSPLAGEQDSEAFCAACMGRSVFASNSGEIQPVQSSAPGYCPSSGNSQTFEYISSVSYEEVSKGTLAVTVNVFITNPSGCESGKPCGTYDSSPEYVNGWIDWNGDFSFDESERIIDAALTGYNGIGYSGTMATGATVPIPDEPADEVWMRVNLGWGHDPNGPCEDGWTFGNVVDTQISLNDLVVKDEEISITTPSKPGDMVTVAYIIHNTSNKIAEDVAYTITKSFEGIDMAEESGSVDIPPKSEFFGLQTWAFDFDKVTIEVDPEDEISESNEDNNTGETHSIKGTVKNNGGSGLEKTRVDYLEQSGADWASKYTCFTDELGEYFIITNLASITDKGSGKVRSTLEYSPESESAKSRLKLFDEAEWGNGQNKAANAKAYAAETGSWTMDITKDYNPKDITYPVHNCLVVYNTLVKAYKYWAGLNPSLAPAPLVEVEVNNDDPEAAGATSYMDPANFALHFWHTRSDKTSSIAHEYAHDVAEPWGIEYNPVGENFANYGSAKSRGVSTYDYWGTELDLAKEEDTDGDRDAGGVNNWHDPIWNFQLAGVYWDLAANQVYAALRQGPDTARQVYDKYEGSPNAAFKATFTKHGIDTTGWPPADNPAPNMVFKDYGDPGDMFTGVYSASKTDSNSDGLADSLNISSQLNIATGGTYYVYGFLKDSSADQYCFASTKQILNPGTPTVTLTFDGRDIFIKRLNGAYTLTSIYIADSDYNELDRSFSPFTTSTAYSYNEFQPPAFYLTGNFNDSGLDTNGDTLYNYLRVEAEISFATAGNYKVDAQLRDSAGDLIETKGTYGFFNAGSQFVNIDFSGLTINGYGADGPYTVKGVFIYDEDDIQVGGGLVPVYSTGAYEYTQFQSPLAGFSGTVTNTGRDTDGDGLFNSLTLGFGLTAASAGDYQVNASLFAADGTFITSTVSSWSLNAGTTSRQVNFPGEAVRQKEVDGPYAYVIDLYEAGSVLIGRAKGNTGAYTWQQFQGFPQDMFALSYSDSASDTNSDSLYDYLNVSISAAAVKAGTYKLAGFLYDQNNQLVGYADSTAALNSTSKSVLLAFDGKLIQSGPGGQFRLDLDIHNADDTLAARIETAYLTSSYNASQFTPAAGALIGTYSDHGSDVNFDSLFEYLDVTVNLNITAAGNYTVQGSLFDTNDSEIDFAAGSSYLESGARSIVLRFSGDAIYENALNGPYKLLNIKLLDSSGALLSKSGAVYLTASYDFSLFGPLIQLSGTYSDSGIDEDYDGIFDFLRVNVGIILANPGYCVASARLIDPAGSEITTASKTAQYAAGANTIMLDFGGPAIFNHAVSGAYLVKDVYVYHTGDPNQPDYTGDACTTGSYQYSQFGITPVVANADTFYVIKNGVLTVPAPGVLSNDTGVEGNQLTAVKVSDPQHGTLTLNADGSFAYTPAALFTGSDSFTYKANDGQTESNEALVTIRVGMIFITSPSSLPPGEVGVTYPPVNLYAISSATPVTWSVPKIPKGNALPPPLKIKASKDTTVAVLSGKPSERLTAVKTYTFDIQVADKQKPQNVATRTFTLTVYPAMKLTVPSSTQSKTEVGVNFTWTPTATGGTGNYTWSLSSALPDGLEFNTQTGVISGAISTYVKSSYSTYLTVTDTNGGLIKKKISLSILKPVTIKQSVLKPGKAGKTYSLKLSATGGKTPYTWSYTGDFPEWATFNPRTGAIGTQKLVKPEEGEWTYTVRVTDYMGGWDTRVVTTVIGP